MADNLPDAPWALPDAPWANEPPDVPQPFLHRVAAGLAAGAQRTGDLLGQGAQSIEKGFGELGSDAPVGVMRHGQPVGLRTRPGVGDIMEGVAGLTMGATGIGMVSAPLEEATGIPKEYTEFALGTFVPLMHQVGSEVFDFYRERNAVRQVIGKLPKDQDFKAAGQVLGSDAAETNLRDLWQERGIHPAEAVHDAQSDAFLKRQLTDDSNLVAVHGNPVTPTKIDPPRASPVPEGTPRSALAMTGDPLVDRVIGSAVTRRAIDNAVIDASHDVPYSAGGSVPLEDPTVFIDRHVPRQMTVDGVTFDPADPFTIHENIEQHVMEVLTKAGMSDDEAYRVAHFEFAEKAEGAWYAAHGIDRAKAEAAYMPFIDQIDHENPTNPPPNLYDKPYPHRNVRDAAQGSVEDKPPTKAMVARAREILNADEAGDLLPAGADVTRPENLPTLAQQPAPRPGRLTAEGRQAIDGLFNIAHAVQEMLDPMATGSNRAMVVAKDTMNTIRRIRWEHYRADADITRRFTPEQQARMWSAADEESVLRQEGQASEHMGLATLEPDERAAVEAMQGRAQAAWLHVRDVGMVEGEGLPAYTPRMVANVALAAEHAGPQALNQLGRNVFTRTSQMLHRKHLMAEDTEAGAKALVERQMTESGATPEEISAALEKVKIVRNIRTLPLATARLEEAAVWHDMINQIEAIGKAVGQDTVAVGHAPRGWFTIPESPAFTRWKPRLEEADTQVYRQAYEERAGVPLENARIPLLDRNGEMVFDRVPIYMPPEFRGPMKAILDTGIDSNPVYGALMALKGKAMTAILNSPLIHNEVVWGKAMEAAGGREWLGFGLYFRGNRIASNPQRAGELIERGLNWTGPRASIQDITAATEGVNLEAGRSLTAKVIGAVPGLWSAEAESATRAAIDKLGDFWHNTLLWDRVRDLQFGLADHLSDRLVAHGADRLTADRIASHFSNIIVGSVPKEAMSAGARATANLFLFSRSFTLGNLATFKQAALGLPKPILAQIERDTGMTAAEAALGEGAAAQVSQAATAIARRKAISTIALSAGLYYIGNALIQHAFNIAARDASVDEEMNGYARRYQSLMADVKENPFELRHLVSRLSPTYDNEPAKQDRAHVGYAADGTAIYARNPTGKFGEEMVGYPTQPMEMLRRKLSPLAGGLLDILTNDQGFGRKVYDTNDGDLQIAVAVGKHLVLKHLPEGQIQGAMDLLRGDGDPMVAKLRTFAPAAGFTVSQGAAGGEARGEQLAAKQAFDTRFSMAWPDIRKQIQRGDEPGARDALKAIGTPPGMLNGLIRNAKDPAGALHGRTLKDFYQYATPQQRERMERDRQ